MADNKYGIASLVLGILSLLIPFLGFICAILAIIFALKQRKIEPNGMATAGLVLGILGLLVGVLLTLLAFIGFMAYFGVLSPDNFLPDKCVAEPPFACTEFQADASSVMVVVQNAAGAPIVVSRATLACADATLPGEPLEPDAPMLLAWRDLPASCYEDGRISSRYAIVYTLDGQERTSEGSIQVRIA